MKRIALSTCLVIMTLIGYTQQGRPLRKITFKVEVVHTERVQFGYLGAVTDSSIVVFKSPVVFDQSLTNAQLNAIAYQNVQEVIVRRKRRVGRGILIGSASGFAAGAAIGAITYKPCRGEFCLDPGQGGQAIGVGLLGAIGGGIVGGIIGSVAKKTFVIGGNKEKFKRMRESVIDMAYKKY
jgi:hypothetical protein